MLKPRDRLSAQRQTPENAPQKTCRENEKLRFRIKNINNFSKRLWASEFVFVDLRKFKRSVGFGLVTQKEVFRRFILGAREQPKKA